ncbi:MAG: ABC transporter permease [Betaproteobacteria bacterium]|nr:ABC transporter permease [Betaproteobacteria bacterium]
MTAWLRQHRHAFAIAAARFASSGGLLSAVVIGIALSLPAGGYALLEGLRGLASRLTLDPQVSVFLRPEAKRADAEALGARLRGDARVLRARFVPREDALKQLSSVQGMPEVIAALGRNPLPDAYVLTVREGAVDALADDLRKEAAVDQVQADAVWARRLAAAESIARLALWLLAAVLAFGTVAVTFNTIRLQILTQQEEIAVSKLLGATDAFIRRPFYYLGLLQGAAGGLLAVFVVLGGLGLLNRGVARLAESYGSAYRLPALGMTDAVAVIAFAGLLGCIGASLSVGRHLRRLDGS